ncbi:ATP-dependent nuclease [Caldifermentibacillus hisashii]|jgi:putative ATP-dependent endonuclease of the OLD family|uniref:ATP-dependent nuclease n=1 Tax=Caldifermentibacillus hisashii TaxID=996558 RepID=UPI0031B6C201
MRLVKAVISNFRGIQGLTEITFNNFNTIVGKNDAGKSTILKALNVFLNEVPFNKDDINVFADTNVTIELYFKVDDENQIIRYDDETIFVLKEILSEDGLLRIKKVWDITRARITSETYIYRKIYETNDYLLLNKEDILELCNQLGIINEEEIEYKEIRIRLAHKLETMATPFYYDYEKLLTSGKSKSKMLNDCLKNVLPKFEYFPADTSLSDSDTAIQNFFKKLAQSTIDQELNKTEIEAPIRNKLQSVFSKITDKINGIVPEEEKVEPEIKFDWTKLVQATFKSTNEEGSIPLSSRGDGFRRITMMSYFEYLAEQDASEQQNIIFGFEEPETFLHPSAQENLFDKLVGMSDNGYQIIITTHSPIIVANSKQSDLIHILKADKEYKVNLNIEDIKDIALDLGITIDNQFITLFDRAKVLFLVEGIDDVHAFIHISNLYKENGLIDYTLEELGITLIPVGGCDSIKHWVTLDLLKTLDKPFFIYLDSDKESEDGNSPNKEKLIDFGFIENEDFLVTAKRELENYIPYSALNRLVPGCDIEYGDWDDVKKICKTNSFAGQLGGKNVSSRHFTSLTFDEIRSTFFNGNEDEFLNIYKILTSKLAVKV